jgi:phosphopantothenoylcysteine decarboxylase/phosphopantothenate--cysteine ligase
MRGKKVILGVTGGIAAYKAAELVRLLVGAEIETRVAMTVNATRFVTPLTFEALSGSEVIWDIWGREATAMQHISWGQGADLIVIAPATANFIAKMAHGIADDFLSTMALAATAKILVCPSMNTVMYLNATTQANLRSLKGRGVTVMEPDEGQLACGTLGAGRLPDLTHIMEVALTLLSPQDFAGLNVLVTAGPTVEPIDPVRYITNRSSGKMGYALAKAAKRRGASVTLVSGPTGLRPPFGVALRSVKTAEEMRETVFQERSGWDIIIKAAAVADYRPLRMSPEKIKKSQDTISLELVRNPDILEELGHLKQDRPYCLVGFAAETQDLLTHAKQKLADKNLDMIVANDVSREDAGFETDTNAVKVIYREGRAEDLPLMSKDDVADAILDRIKTIRERRLET